MSAAFYHDITFTYDAHLCYRVVAHNQYGDGESNELCGDTLSPGLIFDPSKILSLTPRSRSITLKLPRVHDWSDYILQRAEGENTSAMDLDSAPIGDIPMRGEAGNFILY